MLVTKMYSSRREILFKDVLTHLQAFTPSYAHFLYSTQLVSPFYSETQFVA